MYALIATYIFVIGLAFGSFSLALVDRMRAKKDWVRQRSACEFCGHVLQPKDLIPVFSWMMYRGKCHYCRNKLSIAYPLIELFMGVAFLASFLFFPFTLELWNIVLLITWLLGLVIMGALFVYDARWFLLPSTLMFSLIVVAAIHRLVYILTSDMSLLSAVEALGGSLFVGAGIFFLLNILSKGEWIGGGDVRLGVAIGLFLIGPVEVWFAIFVASVLGLLVALPSVRKNKKVLRTKIPFGPMLIVGLYVAYLWSSQVISWYSATFLYLQ